MRLSRLVALGSASAGLTASLVGHLDALGGRVRLALMYQPLLWAAVAVYGLAMIDLWDLRPVLRHAGAWRFLRLALYGAPRWTRWFAYLAPLYIVATVYLNGGRLGEPLRFSQVGLLRFYSAAFLVIYALSVVFLYARYRRGKLPLRWRCDSGHVSAEPVEACPECGAQLWPVRDLEALAPNQRLERRAEPGGGSAGG